MSVGTGAISVFLRTLYGLYALTVQGIDCFQYPVSQTLRPELVSSIGQGWWSMLSVSGHEGHKSLSSRTWFKAIAKSETLSTPHGTAQGASSFSWAPGSPL